ncbi:sulfurtransferase [Brevibacterium jeotgali]|uniref:Thiosulfate/3-mercaptopyruvate sulfurtransferase n=1 Tax=Brevibacterium jeotgali TaxID=1262550 RepID=A0A2H1L5Q8_9MICO|nr:sulfurtransferase [Brevibacterium jeotgali]TWB98923.1 thiosulfate/3-mercaptopyruvate sulfurtransferase [Brevibacterium jeotgali]SMY12246.1 thiosulfate/3-mercaptopyruvate sulfurtransferase [Brevibacterium jeotgali]
MTETRSRVLLTVDELADLLRPDSAAASPSSAARSAPVLLDVRWTLTQPDGRQDFSAGHIPGAQYVALDTELSDHTSDDPARGRHPLPREDQFEATVRSWGVRTGTPVVVYDDVAGQAAARAWWMLRWAGHDDVRVLDGGWSAWRDAGLPEATGLPEETGQPDEEGLPDAEGPRDGTGASDPTASSGEGGLFVIRPGSMPSLTADEAAALAGSGSGVLLDARAPERFEGRAEPLDPQAGHIPGAHNAPAGSSTANGHFRSSEELVDYYGGVGAADTEGMTAEGTIRTIGAYCGSGVSASHTVLALASIGVEAALFPGSWSAWSNDSARPVATGTAEDETVHPPQA